MSIQAIISRFFSSTASIQRRTTSLTSTGDVSETWLDIATNVMWTVQPLSIGELSSINYLNQGEEYTTSHKGYLPDNVVVVKSGDRITDTVTGIVYEIINVQHFEASRSDIALGHHYKLFLQIPRDTKS